jgi:hypothetical protein
MKKGFNKIKACGTSMKMLESLSGHFGEELAADVPNSEMSCRRQRCLDIYPSTYTIHIHTYINRNCQNAVVINDEANARHRKRPVLKTKLCSRTCTARVAKLMEHILNLTQTSQPRSRVLFLEPASSSCSNLITD